MTHYLQLLGHASPRFLAVVGAGALIPTAATALILRRVLRGKKAADTLTVIAAAMASSVAATGMWHFFSQTMHLPTWIQTILFAFMEVSVLASALRARANVARDGNAGADGLAVWILTCASGLMSASEAGSPQEALVRLGAPLVAAWLWERSMVPERRAQRVAATREGRTVDDSFTAKISRTLREQFLARIGVTAPNQSALEIRQNRALRDAVRLADRLAELDGWFLVKARRQRLARRLRNAVGLSGAASDAQRSKTLLNELRAVRHATGLATLEFQSPWNPDEESKPGSREPQFPGSTRGSHGFQSGTDGTGGGGNCDAGTAARNPGIQERELPPGAPDVENGNSSPQVPAAHVGSRVVGTQESHSMQEPGTRNGGPGTGATRSLGSSSSSPAQVSVGTGTGRNRPPGTVTTLVPKDEQLRIVRELGPTVPLADIRERLGCSKAQASRLRSQIAAEANPSPAPSTPPSDQDDETHREAAA